MVCEDRAFFVLLVCKPQVIEGIGMIIAFQSCISNSGGAYR